MCRKMKMTSANLRRKWKSRSAEDFHRTKVTCTIFRKSLTCQHFKVMGMSQRYTDAHLSLVDLLQRSEDAKSLSGAPICAPALYQPYNLAVLSNKARTNCYVIIFVVQLKPNTWHTKCCKIGND